ncbi:DUF7373 family lipoprotein [Nocardia aurea]|uniref:DUF7373 family lipoprotein n=1 Tax=Nocardia aurea TaxID=2144174 RepID=UPI0033B35978
MPRVHVATAALLALALTVGACGDDESTTPKTPEVQIGALDSGNHNTTPIDVERARTPESGSIREAIRIGAVTPLMVDIDNRLIFNSSAVFNRRLITPTFPPDVFVSTEVGPEEFNAVAPGLIAGWYSSGQRRDKAELGRTATLHTLRFGDATLAGTALRALADRTAGTEYAIPGHPETAAKASIGNSLRPPAVDAWSAHNDMLIHVRVEDPLSVPVDPAPMAELAGRIIDRQIEMLSAYAPTPVDKIATQPLDVDGILSRVPLYEKNDLPVIGANPWGVYPRQVALQAEEQPHLARPAFADAGVEFLAIGNAVLVYRTQDNASTTRLIAALRSMIVDEDIYQKADSPPNLPSAQCVEAKPNTTSTSRTRPLCWVPIGRDIAQVTGQNLQDTHQRTAAQYKLMVADR